MKNGQVNEAIHHFSEVININPSYRDARENLNRLQSR